MAANQGDLLQLTTVATYYGQQCLNVYYYRYQPVAPSADDVYEAIVDWFVDNVLEQVRQIQNVNLTYTGIEVRNLSNGVDFYNLAITPGTLSGTVTGEGLPSYVTYGFRLNRESLATRNGYKRFSGVSESQGSGNSYTPPAGNITNLTGELAEDIVIGLVTIAEPVIVKRPISVPAGAYVYSGISSADFRGVGTQNTRKPGSGI